MQKHLRGFKYYGLKGKTVKIKMKESREDPDADPWAYQGSMEQRARVAAETPYYLTLEILPHFNPAGFGESAPYPTTIHKHDILTGRMILRTLGGVQIKAEG